MNPEQVQDKPHYEVALAWPGQVFCPMCCARIDELARDGFDKLLHDVRRRGGTLELRLHDGAGNTSVLERYTREASG